LIFLTVGSQVPFDRLSRSVDAWAARNPQAEVFGQIGRTAWRPAAMQWAELLSADEYVELLKRARVIVAHAGMGTVISAAEHGKPLIVMPRRADLGEHRNDHQEFTAKWLMTRSGISVVHGEDELWQLLDKAGNARASRRPRFGILRADGHGSTRVHFRGRKAFSIASLKPARGRSSP
jgi:UDP-N-acetylglucosamine transferase subunit ALG13